MEKLDIVLYMKESFENAWENRVDDLVRFCRQMQKDYIEGDGDHSGTYFLYEMAANGKLGLRNMMNMVPAIENYKEEYTITIKK